MTSRGCHNWKGIVSLKHVVAGSSRTRDHFLHDGGGERGWKAQKRRKEDGQMVLNNFRETYLGTLWTVSEILESKKCFSSPSLSLSTKVVAIADSPLRRLK
ncbi:hypothetical protein RIF29_40549 [Crotalaria pallida]|uniref:Uncharacterized protein n=1 Tax=Crotalaria pallida TaxID=3830 RepID=A0AAN9HNK1_CROPI